MTQDSPAPAPAPALVLLNGAPGSGKSTLAALLAAQRPLALALDIDTLKHSLGAWDQDLQASGLQARRLAVALIRQHLADRHDVIIGQYLARTTFLEELEQLATDCGARFVEAALVVDEETLAQRLAGRRAAPDRPEQAANDRFVGPADAPELVRSIEVVLAQRPATRRIDGRRSRDDVLAALIALLSAG
ncbi:AAA family ATPase [Brachybacterium tyrofermentans]|uniref:AAA family ATPase n=1 Tax=Brachybacterium tyrofermentans TaxID=47848 RepID=UPI003FCF73BA